MNPPYSTSITFGSGLMGSFDVSYVGDGSPFTLVITDVYAYTNPSGISSSFFLQDPSVGTGSFYAAIPQVSDLEGPYVANFYGRRILRFPDPEDGDPMFTVIGSDTPWDFHISGYAFLGLSFFNPIGFT